MLNGPELKNSSGSKPDSLIIILHGYGADGDNMIDLAHYFAPHLPNAHFISPNACQKFEYGDVDGYQWFSLMDRSPHVMYNNMLPSAKIVDEYITNQLDRFELTSDRLILVGFSQGTMMSLHVAPRRKEKIGGVIGFSGMLLGGKNLEKEAKSKPEILLLHGDQDDVVPYAAMEDSYQNLQSNQFKVEKYRQPQTGHYISNEGLNKAMVKIKQMLKVE